jgi:hypothetical protein
MFQKHKNYDFIPIPIDCKLNVGFLILFLSYISFSEELSQAPQLISPQKELPVGLTRLDRDLF